MVTYSVVSKEPLAVVVITLCLDIFGIVPNGSARLLISVVVDPLSSSASSGLALRGMPCINCTLLSRMGATLLVFVFDAGCFSAVFAAVGSSFE